ncbi:phosphohydrolase [Candidatus Saccharibacteria bacterium]|nr:phosphohydrolase [Candidatus Saccharibacteria bacterium]
MGIIEYRRDEEGDLVRHVIRYVKDFFEGDASGHDYYHSLRVYKMAMK